MAIATIPPRRGCRRSLPSRRGGGAVTPSSSATCRSSPPCSCCSCSAPIRRAAQALAGSGHGLRRNGSRGAGRRPGSRPPHGDGDDHRGRALSRPRTASASDWPLNPQASRRDMRHHRRHDQRPRPAPPRPRSSETPWCAAVPFLPSLWLAWPDSLPTRLLEIARGRGPRAGRCGNAGPAGRFGGYRRSVAAEEILSELRQLGEPQRVAALRRSGVTSPAFGVGLPALRSLAKRIGRDRELALALWETGVREARILASLIDERERVTRSQMDRWA
jgi:hypothetical protein